MTGRANPFDAEILSDQSQTGGLNIQFMAEVSANLGRVAAALDRQAAERLSLINAIHPVNGITCPQITTANGTANYPDLLGPRNGKVWEVRRMAAQTFTGGTVNTYRNAVADQNLLIPFAQSGVTTLGGGQVLLLHGDFIVVSASSVSGNVTFAMDVIEIDEPWLGAYLL